MTIRYGAPRARYEVLDVDAPDLRAALRDVADRMTEEITLTAELAEVRRQVDPDERAYTAD